MEAIDLICLWIGRVVFVLGWLLFFRYIVPAMHDWLCQNVSVYSWLRDSISFPYWVWNYNHKWQDKNKQFLADAIYYKEYGNWVARYFYRRLRLDGFTPSEEIIEAKNNNGK